LVDDEAIMRRALVEAERARGGTGDNPWVGCVIVDPYGAILCRGHTRGPGENHAEVGALRELDARGKSAAGATLYSTLEPCSFHGRTPACAQIIVDRGIARVVIGMGDPHPRVDGEGVRILQQAGVQVVQGVCERDVRRQLGEWILTRHPHEPIRRARSLVKELVGWREVVETLVDLYATDAARAEAIVRAASASRR
jgi:diaminohydroxyphosphoribosylaminopyrimidine deaminase/5-amino-6-(5-phosphoribosylamino)uracil reductase